MNPTASGSISQTGGAVKTILKIWLIAGTLDMVTALIVYQMDPVTMGKFIASGAFGREAAFSGGLWMAFAGFLFHYIIAMTWTILFFLVYPKVKILSKNKYVTGLLYGVVVWLVMNRIILPLSQIPLGPFNFGRALLGMVILMIMIGLPISILTHRYYSRK